MEIINSIYDIVKNVAPTVWTCVKYQLCFGDYFSKFKESKKRLQARQEVIESRIQTEVEGHSGKIESREVRDWLDRGDKMIQDVEEDKVNKVKCFAHICVAKYLDEKTKEMKEIYDEGEKYTKVDAILVVDDHSRKGIAVPTPELQGRDAIKTEILKYLLEDKITRIGVCGLGGIGKTTIIKHVHNELLKRETKFKKVVLVTVSRQFDIIKLQRDIASQLKVSLPEEDATMRAARLFETLAKGNYLLILDDVWEYISLEKVGIPDSVGCNGCKLVLTTRFRDVARMMDCKIVNVEPLPKNEALQLFLSKVGNAVLSFDGGVKRALEPTLRLIVEECGGLPLAIVTFASTMKGKSSPHLWENALSELRNRKRTVAATRIVEGTMNEAFEILKFSYDHLEDEKTQYCFLYCALYPEDHAIRKWKLIEQWIEEGFIAKMETRHEMYCKGHAILSMLEDNCLIETVQIKLSRVVDDEDEKYVKVHDLLRAMALDITRKSPRFLVKSGMNIRALPNKEEWKEDLEKVSLMRNSIQEIPRDLSSPECRMLTTLLLSHNNLSTIPDSFFEHMNKLKILDLSKNYGLKSLPSSISKLENLTTLVLKCCENLAKVPNVSNLRALTKLDLNRSGIEEVPEGMDMLVNLKYLDLDRTNITKFPEGTLLKLSCLQILALKIYGMVVKAEDFRALRKLEYFSGVLRGWNEFSIFFKIMRSGREWLRGYNLNIGSKEIEQRYRKASDTRLITISSLPTTSEKNAFLPPDVQEVEFIECHDFRCLNQLSFLNNAVNLIQSAIFECQGMEFAFSSLFNFNPLQSLQYLGLYNLENLKSLFEEEALAPSALSFPLKYILISSCPKIKMLFSPTLLVRHLQNLESIIVMDCKELEEIIASEESEEEEGGKLPLHKLKLLGLRNMPKLKSICGRTRVLVCDSLENLGIRHCPMLKRVPLSPPPSLKEILVSSKESWESLEWEHPNAKDILLPFVEFLR